MWDPHTQEHINQIEMVQRRAARYVCNRHHNTASVSDMLTGLHWRPLYYRRIDARLCMLYKIAHGLVLIPSHIYLLPIHKRSRHNHSLAYQIPPSKADYHLYSFFPRTIRLWNLLPDKLVTTPSLEAFKSQVTSLQYDKFKTNTLKLW